MNNHVFKGHKTLFGAKYVTYAELELPTYYDLYAKSKSFDWGFLGSAALQLSFAILYRISQNAELSEKLAQKYSQEIVKYFGKDWILTAKEVEEWITENDSAAITLLSQQPANQTANREKQGNRTKRRGPSKDNIVKRLCKEIGITQKELARILEVPEGTVSSWAVKNEIPRLGKKAIEFYIESKKNEEIIQKYKNFVEMLQHSA